MATPFSPLIPLALESELRKIEEEARTLVRVSSSRARVGQTPKEVIWTLNKARLYRYIPALPPEQRHKIPLLLVFALMNRPYILDLRPGYSFVEYMVKQGYDVYLLDYLPRAIRKMKAVSGSDEFSLLGWCIGAIISASYAALRPDSGLKNLILLTAPLDFTDK